MKLAACLLCAALGAVAQPPRAGCIVAGHVLYAGNGEPVRNAKLRLTLADRPTSGADTRGYITQTDDQGRFAMQDIEPGKYSLSAERAGVGSADHPSTISLAAGEQVSGVVLRLTPYAVITGRIVDQDGEPVEHVEISVLRSVSRRGKREFWPAGRGSRTDDLGEYRLFDLTPGRYYVQAEQHADALVIQSQKQLAAKLPDEVGAPTFYPGTTDITNAVAIEAKAGAQIRGIDFVFAKVHAVHIRGHIKYPSKLRYDGAMIAMINVAPRGNVPNWSLTRQAETEAEDGSFDLANIAPGHYTLSAFLINDNERATAYQQIDVGREDINDVVLALEQGASLPGRVIFEGQLPENLMHIEVALGSPDGSATRYRPTEGKLKEDGSFVLGNVGADIYRVLVFGLPQGYYVKSVRFGDKAAKAAAIDTTRDASGPLLITVSARAGQIEGVVLDANQRPTPGAIVVLAPDPPLAAREEAFEDVTTDQHGHFVIKTIEPGDYRLFAWEKEPDDYMDPEVLKPVEALGHRVQIREGSRERVELKLIPAAPSITVP